MYECRIEVVDKMNVENMENFNARGILWEDEEVLALIHIWGDSRIQQDLDGCYSFGVSHSYILPTAFWTQLSVFRCAFSLLV